MVTFTTTTDTAYGLETKTLHVHVDGVEVGTIRRDTATVPHGMGNGRRYSSDTSSRVTWRAYVGGKGPARTFRTRKAAVAFLSTPDA